MPTFVYKMNAKIYDSRLSDYNKKYIERDFQEYFSHVIPQWIARKFGSCTSSRCVPDRTFTFSAQCTEEQSDSLISELSSETYLCVDKVYGGLCYFVSFQKSDKGGFEYTLHSSISQSRISNGDADDEEESRDREEYANNIFIGCENEVDGVSVSGHDGVVFVTAGCTGAVRSKIIAGSLLKVNVNVQKVYGGEICFWPEYVRRSKEYNRVAAEDRAAALFKTKTVEDPLDRNISHTFSNATVGERPTTFKLVPDQFLRRAERMPPANPQPTASGFSQWVYSLYSNAYGDEEDRERGKEVEQAIFNRRQNAASSADNSFLKSIGSDWRLIHNGLHLDGREQVDYFVIEGLRVNGEPLRASPDLIYRNATSSDVVIVEIKFSRLPITTNLWPNVWAQLWCYAQLKLAQQANSVAVIGEVWGERWTRSYGRGRNRVEGDPLLCLRASVRRDPRAPAYDKFFRSLFDIYCGKGI